MVWQCKRLHGKEKGARRRTKRDQEENQNQLKQWDKYLSLCSYVWLLWRLVPKKNHWKNKCFPAYFSWTFQLSSAVCLLLTADFQLFVYFWQLILSYLFTSDSWFLDVCLLLTAVCLLFYSCLFTFLTADCLHFDSCLFSFWQLFVYCQQLFIYN